MAAINKTNNKR